MGKLYLYFFPILNILNFSNKLTFPILISLISLFGLAFKKISFTKSFSFIMLFVLFESFFSLALNMENIDSKVISHQIALISTFLLYFFVPLQYIKKIEIYAILKVIFLVFLVSMVLALFEFFDRNISHANFSLLIPRASVEEYSPTFFALYIRSRSFFEESAHYASYMAVILPFIYLYIKEKSLILKLFVSILVIMTSYSVFSTAFFIFTTLGMFIIFIKSSISISNIYKVISILLISIALLVVFNNEIVEFINNVIIAKFDSFSFYDRNTKTLNTIELMINSGFISHLFGYGMGSYEYLGIEPAINVYINLYRDIGIIGLLLFVFLFIWSFIYIRRYVKLEYQNYFIFSILMVMMFFFSIGNYFYPHFWIPFILMNHPKVLK